MLDWLIIGGGIQGMTTVTYLLQSGRTTVEKICIVDSFEKPLMNWEHCTSTIEMPFLRSPFVHHLEVDHFGLQAFEKRDKNQTSFYGRFKRPSISLFKKHCDHLFFEMNIEKAWKQGRVTNVEKVGEHWKVALKNGSVLESKHVVIAIGVAEQPIWPEWATQLKREFPASIFHIFEPNLTPLNSLETPITIVGGGMTAAHLAVKLANLYPGNVRLLKRHPFRIKPFDSDPAWLGPKNQYRFRKLTSYEQRREMIKKARHKGSITQDLYLKLIRLKRNEQLEWVDGDILGASRRNGKYYLTLENDQQIESGSILLTTGFHPSLPGQDWIAPLIEREHLKCAKCGYPIISEKLEWAPGLYVTGALAELEVGPIARNISGARQAAERIVF